MRKVVLVLWRSKDKNSPLPHKSVHWRRFDHSCPMDHRS